MKKEIVIYLIQDKREGESESETDRAEGGKVGFKNSVHIISECVIIVKKELEKKSAHTVPSTCSREM